MQLCPLVCQTEDLIANECHVKLEVVTVSDADPAIVGEDEDAQTENEVQDEVDDAQYVTTTVHRGE